MPTSCHQFLIFEMPLIPLRCVIYVNNVLKHFVAKVWLQKVWTLVGHLEDCFEGYETANTSISDSQAFLFWEFSAQCSQRMPSLGKYFGRFLIPSGFYHLGAYLWIYTLWAGRGIEPKSRKCSIEYVPKVFMNHKYAYSHCNTSFFK